MPPRKRDCLKDLASDFGVGTPSVPMTVLLPELLPELVMRKKFLIRCGMSFEPFVSREELDMPEKFRFSLCMVEFEDEELKSWVIVAGWFPQCCQSDGNCDFNCGGRTTCFCSMLFLLIWS